MKITAITIAKTICRRVDQLRKKRVGLTPMLSSMAPAPASSRKKSETASSRAKRTAMPRPPLSAAATARAKATISA